MQKLIKLEEHFYIVDDSEIKKGDLVIDNNELRFAVENFPATNWCKKITHSTQPLENVIKISLLDIEEVVYGYNLLKMVENFSGKDAGSWQCPISYEIGFKAHQELVKDKLFTTEDMINAFKAGRQGFGGAIKQRKYDWNNPYDYIKSLLSKTEWNITIDENNKITLI
jgi:hypothetical protein